MEKILARSLLQFLLSPFFTKLFKTWASTALSSMWRWPPGWTTKIFFLCQRPGERQISFLRDVTNQNKWPGGWALRIFYTGGSEPSITISSSPSNITALFREMNQSAAIYRLIDSFNFNEAVIQLLAKVYQNEASMSKKKKKFRALHNRSFIHNNNTVLLCVDALSYNHPLQ